MGGQPQEGGPDYAGGIPAMPGEKEMDQDHRQQPPVLDLSKPDKRVTNNPGQPGLGCGYHVYPIIDGVYLSGGGHGSVLSQDHWVGDLTEH